MENAATEFSIDAPMGDDEDMCYADTMVSYMPATDSEVMHESLCADINRWLGIFDKDSERDQRQYEKAQRAKDIIIRSFGLNGTNLTIKNSLFTFYICMGFFLQFLPQLIYLHDFIFISVRFIIVFI